MLGVAGAQPRLALRRIHLERSLPRPARACRRRARAAVAAVSPLSRSRSRPYSRNVSSMMEARLAVVGHTLDEQAVVDERGDADQDVDAQVLARRRRRPRRASSVQPPAKTESRRKSVCSAGVSRS